MLLEGWRCLGLLRLFELWMNGKERENRETDAVEGEGVGHALEGNRKKKVSYMYCGGDRTVWGIREKENWTGR